MDDFQEICKDLLFKLDPEPLRQGLLKTPERMANLFAELTEGYRQTYSEVVGDGVFTEDVTDDIVIVKGIEFYSLCEHHVLPFFGKCSIAYLPDKEIIGLSKLARICDMYAKRLQVQERLTKEICQCIEENLKPKGVAVIIEAQHLCMMMRGVDKQSATTITSSMKGVFLNDAVARNELMVLLR